MPEDFPVPESASEPHDETQRHQAVHLQRVRDGVHPVAPPEAAHAHPQSKTVGRPGQITRCPYSPAGIEHVNPFAPPSGREGAQVSHLWP